DEEKRKTSERGDEFRECAAQDGHDVAERAEERMTGFVDEEIGKVDEKEVVGAEGGVKEEERVGNEPGYARDFGNGFPFAQIVGGEIVREGGHETRVASGRNGKKAKASGSFKKANVGANEERKTYLERTPSQAPESCEEERKRKRRRALPKISFRRG